MNTKPDDHTLTQWMDGELDGAELQRIETWATKHPELLAERESTQTLSSQLKEHIVSSEEPPYPDFFNQRILRAIEEEESTSTPALSPTKPSRGFWQWIAMPLAAGAMALCFYLGMQVRPQSGGAENNLIVTQPNPNSQSTVYTPDGAVKADIFNTRDAKATVIVLEGLDDLPDDLEMAGAPLGRPSGSMMIQSDDASYTY